MIEKKSIWKKPITLDSLTLFSADCMVSHIGIEFTDIGPDYLCARMPVDERTKQPVGLLHGGASVALAETVASTAAYCCVEEGEYAVGIEINANHVRKADSGWVEAISRPVHIGRTTQVWETMISNPQGELISVSRMTLSVLKSTSK